MINIQRGYEDWKELSEIVSNVKTLNTFVDLVDGNNRYEITNDLRDEGMVDLNYKSICATILQKEDKLELDYKSVEVWDEDGALHFVNVNMYSYNKYRTTIRNDGRLEIDKLSPYDEQEYYWAIDNKIYRGNKYIESIDYDEESNLTLVDTMILKLMEKNSKLKGITAIW